MTEARAVTLSVSALSPSYTPRSASPTTGHLRYRGWALAEARALTLGVSVLSKSRNLRIDSVTPSTIYTGQSVPVTLAGVIPDVINTVLIDDQAATILSQTDKSIVCVPPELIAGSYSIVVSSDTEQDSIALTVVSENPALPVFHLPVTGRRIYTLHTRAPKTF